MWLNQIGAFRLLVWLTIVFVLLNQVDAKKKKKKKKPRPRPEPRYFFVENSSSDNGLEFEGFYNHTLQKIGFCREDVHKVLIKLRYMSITNHKTKRMKLIEKALQLNSTVEDDTAHLDGVLYWWCEKSSGYHCEAKEMGCVHKPKNNDMPWIVLTIASVLGVGFIVFQAEVKKKRMRQTTAANERKSATQSRTESKHTQTTIQSQSLFNDVQTTSSTSALPPINATFTPPPAYDLALYS